jgi:hypothetical protein
MSNLEYKKLRGRVIELHDNNMESKQKSADCHGPLHDFTSLIDQLEGDDNLMIKDILRKMNFTIVELQNSNTFILSENTELRKDLDETKKRLNLTESLVTILRKQNQQQNDDIIDLQARSMRDNLIFTGIEEKPNENTPAVLQNFLKQNMKISDAESLTFDRVPWWFQSLYCCQAELIKCKR